MSGHQKLRIKLQTQDQYPLIAYRYFSMHTSAKGIIVVAGATGVAQRFYSTFAQAAIERGYHVVTVDYRGIGESAPSTLKGFEMRYLDWATQDLAAAVDYANQAAAETYHPLPVYLVGHSYGGHALGLLPNVELISAASLFGTGSGWHGWMPKTEGYKVWFLWNIVAPVIVRIKGYLGWSLLGMGEDLPKGVYQDWKYWCKFPNYFFDDPKMSYVQQLFARCHCDIRAINAIDDKWAQPRSRDAFFRGYRNAKVQKQDLNPVDFSMQQIDHMGYFKKTAIKIWDQTFDWFDQRSPDSLFVSDS